MAALGCNMAAMVGAPAVEVVVSKKAYLGSSIPMSQCLGLSKFWGLRAVRSDVASDVAVLVRNLKAKHLVQAVASPSVETLEKTDLALMEKSVTTIWFLSVDAVEKANSRHQGLPMAMCSTGIGLWYRPDRVSLWLPLQLHLLSMVLWFCEVLRL